MAGLLGFPNVSGAQILTAGVTGEYGSFPYSWPRGDAPSNPIPSGSYFTGYRNWNGSVAAAHATGGAAYLRRNGGASVMLYTAASEGAQIQDVFPVTMPWDNTNIWMYLRLYDFGTANYTIRYAVSTNDGITWPATTLLPPMEGYLSSDFSAFMGFLPSANNSKLYGFTFGREPGQSVNSCAVHQTTDGINWTLRNWVRRGAQGGGDEFSACRLPNPSGAPYARLITAIRPVVNGDDGFTSYSDDDGATWSTPAVQVGFKLAGGAQSVALSADRWYCLGRDWAGVEADFPLAWWLFDKSGVQQSGYAALFYNGNASNGGYGCTALEASGQRFAYFYWDKGVVGSPPVIGKCRLTHQIVGQAS